MILIMVIVGDLIELTDNEQDTDNIEVLKKEKPLIIPIKSFSTNQTLSLF